MEIEGNVLPRDFNKNLPLAVKARGIYIEDEAGNTYIDGCSGALISNIGHCVPEVVEAITNQMCQLNFAHPSRWRNEAAEEAAQLISEMTPGDLNYVWFVSGGSEANESAIKLSRQYYIERDGITSAKHLVVGRWNSYHGATLGTMAIAGDMPRRRIFAPMFMEHPKTVAPYCYRCPFGMKYPSCDIQCAYDLERVIKQVGSQYIAAFIAEPMVGSVIGALEPPAEYLPIVREICNKYDIHFIADEVMVGFGRTGANFCVDHWDVIPDMITSAKGMAAGYVPTGGVFIKEKVAEVLKKGSGAFVHGYTYNSNPVSAAATAAVIKYIKKHDLVNNSAKMGLIMENELKKLENIPIVGQVRGKGLMWGIELVLNKDTKEPFPKKVKANGLVAEECMKRGLIIYPGGGMVNGVDGDNFLVAPPLIVTEKEIIRISSILEEALKAANSTLLDLCMTA